MSEGELEELKSETAMCELCCGRMTSDTLNSELGEILQVSSD